MSLPISVAQVKAVAPELTGSTYDTLITAFIALADQSISPDAWGSRAELAEAYLTAHMMVLCGAGPWAGMGGPRFSGVLTEIQVGQTTVQAQALGVEAVAAANLLLSKFGLLFDGLLKQAALGFVVP